MVEPTIHDLRLLRDQGQTYEEIGRQYGLSRQAVYARLHYHGTTEYNAQRRIYQRKRRAKNDGKAN